jgi:phenylacetate-coenzyme A ligase PaaK-like adenylate-forming protein
MPSYQELQRRHVAEAMAMLPEHIDRMGWSAERLAVHRSAALRRLVRTAQDRSPWHRRRLAGVDPDTLVEEGLAALPVMTKDDLMANYDEILTDPLLNRDINEAHIAALSEEA